MGGGLWHRIYTSDHDGLAFNRLQNALLGYGGPTLLIIRESKCGGMFGAYSATRWKESKDFYGTSECFLFRLKPSLAVYKSKFSSENYMYCNSAARSKGYDGLAHGIGFGGTSDQPRLFISECFDQCFAASGDLSFEAGALLPPPKEGAPPTKHFDIESLEVWGVGGNKVINDSLITLFPPTPQTSRDSMSKCFVGGAPSFGGGNNAPASKLKSPEAAKH